jgi:hypothetical protein
MLPIYGWLKGIMMDGTRRWVIYVFIDGVPLESFAQ